MPQGATGNLWRVLVMAGVVLVAAGFALRWAPRGLVPGRLPGDLVLRGKHITVFLPLATSLLLSLLLTLLFNLLRRR